MSNSATYTFKLNQSAINQVERNAVLGLLKMGYDINNRAKSKAPVGVYPPKSGKTGGALVNSIRVDESDMQGGTVYVLAGGTTDGYKVPHAKRREYENNKNPHTKYYVRDSFNEVTKNYTNYFKGITK